MKLFLPVLALVAASTTLQAQIRHDTAIRVAKSDPIYPALEEYRSQIQKRYEDTQQKLPIFSEWVLVQSPAAVRLFPSLRFAAISWNERAYPDVKDRLVNLAVGLQTTVGVETSSNQIQIKLSGFGNYEAFGTLLASNRIRIQNATDAKTVWEAFCDLHFKHWQNQPAVKVSDKIWHLGDVTIGQFHYYYEVILDEDCMVNSARLHADEVKMPEEY
jgi:hypothetical protein